MILDFGFSIFDFQPGMGGFNHEETPQ